MNDHPLDAPVEQSMNDTDDFDDVGPERSGPMSDDPSISCPCIEQGCELSLTESHCHRHKNCRCEDPIPWQTVGELRGK